MLNSVYPRRRRLRPYQEQGVAYANRIRNPALFFQMRLGKTLPTIRWAKSLKPRNPRAGLRALVVAPSGALGSWTRELELEGSGGLPSFVAHATSAW